VLSSVPVTNPKNLRQVKKTDAMNRKGVNVTQNITDSWRDKRFLKGGSP